MNFVKIDPTLTYSLPARQVANGVVDAFVHTVEQKRAKLLQYADRVWNITSGSENEKIEQAIVKTEAFFQSLGVKTKLSGYGIDVSGIDKMVEGLKAKGMTALSESQDLTLNISRKIYEAAL